MLLHAYVCARVCGVCEFNEVVRTDVMSQILKISAVMMHILNRP